jgi:hypothetical protein
MKKLSLDLPEKLELDLLAESQPLKLIGASIESLLCPLLREPLKSTSNKRVF